MQGFGPAADPLLFRQKWTKPVPPVRGPPGPFAPLPNQDGSETRCAQTVFAKKSDSVRRLSRARRRGDTQETNQVFTLGADPPKTQYSCLTPNIFSKTEEVPAFGVAETRSPIREVRWRLFERSELRHRRMGRASQGPRRATPRRKWFWSLLPKQK